ncbi:glycoside hydrolase family 68 protein [Novosphingobium guangzhouense]|uniref:Levansucrase n=1 Tax=Novosphingobium guangzhouense TaxID=1850347 RepID=A0A2K2G4H2_9SPHN|nr:glycoside hydrolase family 68 protein [Novosphingobium guangzhouense]PNU05933.1 levansucrase [Novosphingobium guangzhouense]
MNPLPATLESFHTLQWTARDLARLADGPVPRAPVLAAADLRRVAPRLDVWDAWPLADPGGAPTPWRGGELWFALAAPAFDDPEERHGAARIHHFHRTDGRFRHLGVTFPDGFTPGSREWSGSAVLEDGCVTLYFTAAGKREEAEPSFRQRIFASTARLVEEGGAVFTPWSPPVEQVIPANVVYMSHHDGTGELGEIKAFRDPAPWRSPAGEDHLLFTASSARHLGFYNGVIGCSRRGDADPQGGTFEKLPPLVDASGVNNELERPHIVAHGGLLYLFWSTQAKVFAPGVDAPTGLYGAVAKRLEGPWRLLNGHGLVFANPEKEPFQAYSWWVLPDLSVASFVDYWGIDDAAADRKPHGRAHFGGTFAPFLHLRLEGDAATLRGSLKNG